MAIVNLTPDSFYAPSRATAGEALVRITRFYEAGASIVDLGAVSTRPGAAEVDAAEEWNRLRTPLEEIAASGLLCRGRSPLRISIDTTRSEIVRKAYEVIGPFIVNDISAGEDDPQMLQTVADLGLTYVAMHKRGNPLTMNGLCDYPNGVMAELIRYFGDFAERAGSLGIKDWILDPGLGFAKTNGQCWEILERLEELQAFGRPILIGAADKRFTREVPPALRSFRIPGRARNDEREIRNGVTEVRNDKRENRNDATEAPDDESGARNEVTEDQNDESDTWNGATEHRNDVAEPQNSTPDGTAVAHALAIAHGADILRVHHI